MPTTIMAQRHGGIFAPVSDKDQQAAFKFPENTLLRLEVYGAKKPRAYRELCTYWGSCKYIANLNLSDYMDTQSKVDHMTRVRLGFIEETFVDPKTGVHFIPKRLDYQSCDQPEAHDFISKALMAHAGLAGLDNVDDYVRYLKGVGR